MFHHSIVSDWIKGCLVRLASKVSSSSAVGHALRVYIIDCFTDFSIDKEWFVDICQVITDNIATSCFKFLNPFSKIVRGNKSSAEGKVRLRSNIVNDLKHRPSLVGSCSIWVFLHHMHLLGMPKWIGSSW